jgi:DNA mismatch repair protein MutL
VIKGIPPECQEKDLTSIIEEILEQTKNGEDIELEQKKIITKTLAIKIAIKKGGKLEMESMKILFKDLLNCNSPTISPNGKPTMINLSLNDITKHF